MRLEQIILATAFISIITAEEEIQGSGDELQVPVVESGPVEDEGESGDVEPASDSESPDVTTDQHVEDSPAVEQEEELPIIAEEEEEVPVITEEQSVSDPEQQLTGASDTEQESTGDAEEPSGPVPSTGVVDIPPGAPEWPPFAEPEKPVMQTATPEDHGNEGVMDERQEVVLVTVTESGTQVIHELTVMEVPDFGIAHTTPVPVPEDPWTDLSSGGAGPDDNDDSDGVVSVSSPSLATAEATVPIPETSVQRSAPVPTVTEGLPEESFTFDSGFVAWTTVAPVTERELLTLTVLETTVIDVPDIPPMQSAPVPSMEEVFWTVTEVGEETLIDFFVVEQPSLGQVLGGQDDDDDDDFSDSLRQHAPVPVVSENAVNPSVSGVTGQDGTGSSQAPQVVSSNPVDGSQPRVPGQDSIASEELPRVQVNNDDGSVPFVQVNPSGDSRPPVQDTNVVPSPAINQIFQESTPTQGIQPFTPQRTPDPSQPVQIIPIVTTLPSGESTTIATTIPIVAPTPTTVLIPTTLPNGEVSTRQTVITPEATPIAIDIVTTNALGNEVVIPTTIAPFEPTPEVASLTIPVVVTENGTTSVVTTTIAPPEDEAITLTVQTTDAEGNEIVTQVTIEPTPVPTFTIPVIDEDGNTTLTTVTGAVTEALNVDTDAIPMKQITVTGTRIITTTQLRTTSTTLTQMDLVPTNDPREGGEDRGNLIGNSAGTHGPVNGLMWGAVIGFVVMVV